MAFDNSSVRITDGSMAWEAGIDSGKIPTIQSQQNPTGLKRNQLAWATNITFRGGGISQRTGWNQLIADFPNDDGLFQGAAIYKPDTDYPYIIAAISGKIYRFNVWTDQTVQEIGVGFPMPATRDEFFFCQAEDVMIIQAGDYTTLPLFWDGITMRRSNGILAPIPGTPGATYNITPTGTWVIPAVGATTALITLTAPYPGNLNDVGNYGVIGSFRVSNIVGNQIQLTTVSSAFVGMTVAAVNVDFVVPAIDGQPNPAGTSEIPSGRSMDYFMGRLWVQVSQRTYTAGDIVYRGIIPYSRHSFLEFTENAYLAGGGSFAVPSDAGEIISIFHTTSLDTTLGQGLLMIGTRESIYSLTVPVSRLEWNDISNTTNNAIQRVVQSRYGPVSDRCVVTVNDDVFYQAYDGIRSLQMARRYFHQWGQVPISRNENRLLQFNNRSFYRFASGIEFDNRVLMTCLPIQTPVGVAHQGLMPLDFDLITSMENLENRIPPAWEGMWEGLDHLQILEESFGGLQRAFTLVYSRSTGKIQVWEITNYRKFDWNDSRVTWFVETPAFDGNKLFQLKELDSAEVWVDKVLGTVDFQLFYRSDQNACWIPWHAWRICSAKTTCENVENPVCYPAEAYCEGYRSGMVMPRPPSRCDQQVMRPSNIGYQFQLKIIVTGWCRIRAILLYLLPRMQGPYEGLVCNAELPMPNS